jgi:hypothetical protein
MPGTGHHDAAGSIHKSIVFPTAPVFSMTSPLYKVNEYRTCVRVA